MCGRTTSVGDRASAGLPEKPAREPRTPPRKAYFGRNGRFQESTMFAKGRDFRGQQSTIAAARGRGVDAAWPLSRSTACGLEIPSPGGSLHGLQRLSSTVVQDVSSLAMHVDGSTRTGSPYTSRDGRVELCLTIHAERLSSSHIRLYRSIHEERAMTIARTRPEL